MRLKERLPERRVQFLREGAHYEGEYALVVQFTPPLRGKSKLVDLIYDDDPSQTISPANRMLEQFKNSLVAPINEIVELRDWWLPGKCPDASVIPRCVLAVRR